MLVSSLLLLFDNWYLNILAGIGWIIGYSLDYTDGGIARLKQHFSKKGVFLDFINHSLNYPVLFICAGAGVMLHGGCQWFHILPADAYLALGVAGGLGCVLVMLMPTLFRRACGGDYISSSSDLEGQAIGSAYMKIMQVNPLTFTNMMTLILVFALFDQMWLFVLGYGIGYPLAAAFRFSMLYKRCP